MDADIKIKSTGKGCATKNPAERRGYFGHGSVGNISPDGRSKTDGQFHVHRRQSQH